MSFLISGMYFVLGFVLVCAVVYTVLKLFSFIFSENPEERLVKIFALSTIGLELGQCFVGLLAKGRFVSVKQGNHGKPFPYKRQFKDFSRNETPAMAEAVRNVGDSLEKYYL